MGIIRRAQGEQGDFIVSGGRHQLPGQFHHRFRFPFPDRPVDDPGVAEPAAPAAAPKQFQHDPVVDRVAVGHNGMGGEIQGVQILLRPFVHHFRCRGLQRFLPGDGTVRPVGDFIEGRDVDSLDPGHPAQESQPSSRFPFPFPVPVQEGHFLDDPFPVPQHAEIQEIRQGFAVEHAASPGTDKRIVQGPVFGQNGDAAQVQHVQDVGIGHFIEQGKAQQVEILQGPGVFQAGEHQSPFPHFGFHVHPGGEGPFRRHPGELVEDFIKDFEAQVAHADFIGIREGQTEGYFRFLFGFDDAAEFHAGITGGLFHSTEYIDG